MDCKRKSNRALKSLLSIVCIMAVMSCTWVKDDNDDCPYGFWLKLRYTYNIMDVEAAPRYVTDAYVYVYDADGKYVKRIHATHGELTANDYRVRVQDLPEGDYQFVVWSGMDNIKYGVTGDNQAIGDFRLSLINTEAASVTELPALYHGYLGAVHFDDSYAVHDVELMKNTNVLACLAVSIDGMTEMNPDDYAFKVVTANSIMDAYNRLTADAETTYEPYVQEAVTLDDVDYGEIHGVMFGISTLRLMSDRNCRIVLQDKRSGQELFNVSFPDYIGIIGALYTNLGKEVSVQEYLDRQDFYTIVFYLSGDLQRLIQLKVNNWRVRANNHLNL